MGSALVVLGSSGAVVPAHRDNTALALRLGDAIVLVDCPGSPAVKLRRAGLDPLQLAAVVITHTHPDHVYGLPSLVHNLRLLGRSATLPIFVLPEDLDRVRRLLAVWGGELHPPFLSLRVLAADGVTPFWEQAGHRLYARPADHSVPTCAVRWDLPTGGRVVYSSDTRPVDELAAFGRGAAVMVHEATYLEDDADHAHAVGHSTAADAGRIAAQAGAGRLLLVHLTPDADPSRWVAEAQAVFPGPVEVPDDGAVYPLDGG
ncbi:MAG: MBL fold metallo-hydrolase [Armatimonadota bacterium]|nr:MBL fold metallo-hydrolase [Armatimonadota bacterium]